MSVDRALLDIVCCPVTRLPLELLPRPRLEQLNRSIAERRIRNRADVVVDEPLEEALVTRDGKLAYPVRDDVPVLLEDEAIVVSQIDSGS